MFYLTIIHSVMMYRQYVTISFLVAVHQLLLVRGDTRIRFAPKEEFTYIVLVRSYAPATKTFTECGGVIITDQSVLTCCSCLTDFEHESIKYDTYFSAIVAGSKNVVSYRARNIQLRHVKSVALHPRCKLVKYGLVAFDLAIVMVEESFTFSRYVSQIELPSLVGDDFMDFLDRVMDLHVPCRAVGWGINLVGGMQNTHVLRVVNLTIISSKDCVEIVQAISQIRGYTNMSEFIPEEIGVICAINKRDNRDVHYGHGGPVICQGIFVGFITKQFEEKKTIPVLLAAFDKSKELIAENSPTIAQQQMARQRAEREEAQLRAQQENQQEGDSAKAVSTRCSVGLVLLSFFHLLNGCGFRS